MASSESMRASFDASARGFASVVAAIPKEDWARPGLGTWSVLDLAGHASRALRTIEEYLAAPAAPVTVAGAVEYFSFMARFADPAAVAERGREAGAELGPDPAAAVAELAGRVRALVAASADDAVVSTPANGMKLIAYLPTRTFELTVHTLDLTVATGVAVPPELAEPLSDCLELAAKLAAGTAQAGGVLLALTGRRPLPAGFSVV